MDKILWHKSWRRTFLPREANAFLFGISGIGKSQFIVANLKATKLLPLEKRPDYILNDPVGEIQAATQDDLVKAGYAVMVIDLRKPTERLEGPARFVRWDPLGFVRCGNSYAFDDDCKAVAELIVENDVNPDAAHWTEVPRAVLGGMISHQLQMDFHNTSITSCLRGLRGGKQKRDAVIGSMRRSDDPLVSDAIEAYDEAGDREKGSFGTTMLRKFSPFLTEPIRYITEPQKKPDGRLDRGWTFDDMFRHPKPVVLFVRTGLQGKRTGPFLRLLLGTAVNTVRRHVDESRSPLRKGLRLFVDEAKTIGNCAPVEDLMDELRKANAHVAMCFLSRNDLFKSYPGAKNMLNNSTWFLPGGGNDYETSEDVSRLLGEKIIMRKSRRGDDESETEFESRLMSAAELRDQKYEDWVVMGNGIKAQLHKPFKRFSRGVEFNPSRRW